MPIDIGDAARLFLILVGATLRTKPAIEKAVAALRKQPTKEERAALVKFTKLLDERRVFYRPYNGEVIEACVGSLSYVKDQAESTLTALEHPAAQAAIGAILDALRLFLDKWHGVQTPSRLNGPRDFRDDDSARETLAAFFQDLGELRGRVRGLVDLVGMIEPKATAPNVAAGR